MRTDCELRCRLIGRHWLRATAVVFASWFAAPLTAAYIYSTGVDSQGNPLSSGIDPHYLVCEVGGQCGPAWIAQGATAQDLITYPVLSEIGWPASLGTWYSGLSGAAWIAPQPDVVNLSTSGEPVTFVYRTYFDLTGYDLTTVVISGLWSMDNQSLGIFLNGGSTPIAGTIVDYLTGGEFAFQGVHSFVITMADGLLPGPNYLDFWVVNADAAGPNPSGMVVQLEGVGVLMLPEPSTLLLIGGGLIVLSILVGRRRKV